jgi:hypothetical protein
MLLQPCQPPPPQTHKFLGQLAVSSGNGRHCLGHHWFPTHSVIIPSTIITRAPAPAGKGSQALCVKRPVPGLGKLLEQELHQGPKAGMVLPWDPMPSSALLQQSLERGTASWLGLSGRGCHTVLQRSSRKHFLELGQSACCPALSEYLPHLHPTTSWPSANPCPSVSIS